MLEGMKTTSGSILAARVRGNNDWLAQCENLYRDEQKRIGQYARTVREQKGVSLRSVATAMGITAPFLSDLERGNRNWTTGTIEKWAKVIDA